MMQVQPTAVVTAPLPPTGNDPSDLPNPRYITTATVASGTITFYYAQPIEPAYGIITWSGFHAGAIVGTSTEAYVMFSSSLAGDGTPGLFTITATDGTTTTSANAPVNAAAFLLNVSGMNLSTLTVAIEMQSSWGSGNHGTDLFLYYPPLVMTIGTPVLLVGQLGSLVTIGHGVNCNAYDNGGYLAATFPPGNGTILGDMTAMRNYCGANGIHVALTQDSQRSAIDIFNELFKIANTAPVYSGNQLKMIPLDEVSAAGNGYIYIAPTTPVAPLTDKDFQYTEGQAPVQMKRDRRANCDNVVAVEYIDRTIDYTHNAVSIPDACSVALYGTRKGGTLDSSSSGVGMPSGAQQMLAIHDPMVALKVASIIVKVSAADLNKYYFTLKAERIYLEAADIVEITDTILGLNAAPVRLLSVKENEDKTLACEAEDFVYGLHHPDVSQMMAATGSLIISNVNPGLVNTPVFLEPTQAMLGSGTAAQLWIVVSGADLNYGGCVGYVSIDGGVSYPTILGNIAPGITGELTADFPVGSDPDITHSLALDLSESNGELSSQSQAVADAFLDQCYLSTAAPYVYESVCPTAVTTTGPNAYTLGTYIRRGVYTTQNIDHPSGSRFASLSTLLRVPLAPQWAGQTLYFKFAAYNLQNGQQNSLANCIPYTYTPQGLASDYASMTPAIALSQPANVLAVVMAPFIVTYQNGTTNSYLTRTFSVLLGAGGAPQTYYVTIYDPNQLGDSAGLLSSYCDTTSTRALETGYFFAGKIIITATGANTGGPGGPTGINAILIVVTPPGGGTTGVTIVVDGTSVGTGMINVDGSNIGTGPINVDGSGI